MAESRVGITRKHRSTALDRPAALCAVGQVIGRGSCDTAAMPYVLGSETELLSFTEHGADVEPVGLAHAVDPASPQNSAGGLLAYAQCGTAVRVWPDREFDPHAQRVHDQCVNLSQQE
jgi:hypothetical protein